MACICDGHHMYSTCRSRVDYVASVSRAAVWCGLFLLGGAFWAWALGLL